MMIPLASFFDPIIDILIYWYSKFSLVKLVHWIIEAFWSGKTQALLDPALNHM